MTLNASPATSSRSDPWLRAALAVSLAFAGVMHLMLAPEHFTESTLMGTGFVLAGVAEIALAAGVLLVPVRAIYVAIVVTAVALTGLYAYNVMVGLPIAAANEGPGHGSEHENGEAHDSGHGEGLQIGTGEPVDFAGGVTKAAEIIAIGLAAAMLVRDRRHRERSGPGS